RPRRTRAGFNLPNLMVKISLFTSRTPSGAGHFPPVDGTYQRTSPRRRPVHVQGEDRRAAAEAVGMIGEPPAHEPPTAGRVREQDPARAAASAGLRLTSSAPSNATDREVVKGRDGIRLRPETHPSRPEPRVPVLKEELAVEPALEVVAEGDDAHRVPLTERRSLDAGARQLIAPAVVVVQAEVVLERVRADDVVRAVCEAEDDAA